MTTPTRRLRAAGLLAGTLVLGLAAPAVSAPEAAVTAKSAHGRGTGGEWIGTWADVPTAVPAGGVSVLEDQTVRQVVHASIGGDSLQVRFTNEFGEAPLLVGEAHVGLRAGSTGTDVQPGTDRRLTFGGSTSTTVPAGAPLLSDPVQLGLPEGGDLVVSIHLPQRTPVTTVHAFPYQDNVVAAGNVTGAERVTPTATVGQWYFLSGVSVLVPEQEHAAAIVALGDSITDGAETTRGANRRWPDLLAQRLREARGMPERGVLNEGVSGNRLLHDPNPPAGSPAEGYAAYFGQSALRRFDRDVAAQPGAEYLVVLLGVNDLGHPGTSAPESETVTAQQIVDAHRQLVARAHQQGMTAIGGTILPFEGDTLGFFSEENEAARQQVNHWIRTSGEYDAVVDFDAALRDPRDHRRLNPRYDSGDGLHPNDAGMRAMADAVPLRLFR
ncbi:SGNH/GDSL hydrolase family protein [Kineococcus indalonis]|uniref:SGNH/GDSL hydrolase family protein n=1 Tax=Kineococcus indalonis TaxID=2696566 RepID=UPI0014129DAC|nr:SGNH/GDSL hydrolase family protein [Kineococcus indalonis]NAZ85795.1 SGNH/GDSL hydrolase family protein [Kineococcus indalonis]